MAHTADHKPAMEQNSPDTARWLTTFNDMITLLMVFFVLLFAMGSTDVKRFHHFQNALQSAMGVLHSGEHAPVGIITPKDDDLSQDARSGEAVTEMSDDIGQLENTEGLEAEITQKGIQLTLNDELLFTSGSARLKDQGNALLDKVGRIIGPLNRLIRVEGHTDNVPISTGRYPSNWELSTARAVRVVKYLQTNGKIPPRKLSAAGYGASKPRALNDSESGRSKNRRVEIILQPEELSHFAK